MKQINRRQFMKKSILVGTGLIGSLAFPSYVFGSSIREILERKPEDVLLAMMIYGETSGCIPLEKLFAGFTPFNRIEAGKSYFGTTSLKNVLLYPKAYNCFDDSEKNKKNLTRILSPNKKDKEWIESVMITKGILRRDWTKTFRGFHGCIESADSIMKGYSIFYNFIRKHQSIKCCPCELDTDLKLNSENKWLELIGLSCGN